MLSLLPLSRAGKHYWGKKRTINLKSDTEGLPSSLQMTIHTAQSYRASEMIFKEVQGAGTTGRQDD